MTYRITRSKAQYLLVTCLVDGVGTTREDDAYHIVLLQLRALHKARIKLTEDIQLSDTTGNQVRILGPKVKDSNLGSSRVKLCRQVHRLIGHG